MQIYEKKSQAESKQQQTLDLSISRSGDLRIYVLKILTFFSSSISWILNFVAIKSTFVSQSLQKILWSFYTLLHFSSTKDVKDITGEFVCFLRRFSNTRWACLITLTVIMWIYHNLLLATRNENWVNWNSLWLVSSVDSLEKYLLRTVAWLLFIIKCEASEIRWLTEKRIVRETVNNSYKMKRAELGGVEWNRWKHKFQYCIIDSVLSKRRRKKQFNFKADDNHFCVTVKDEKLITIRQLLCWRFIQKTLWKQSKCKTKSFHQIGSDPKSHFFKSPSIILRHL